MQVSELLTYRLIFFYKSTFVFIFFVKYKSSVCYSVTYFVFVSFKYSFYFIPLSRSCATFLAEFCNTVTRQPIELESCSNQR